MRVTIIRDDNTVIVDGEAHHVDCSTLPTDFHALQWAGDLGEIEYRMLNCAHCGGRSKKQNVTIADMVPYQPYVDGWRVAKATADAARAAVHVREAKANAAG